MNVVHFAQLDKDTILLCAESEHLLRFVQYFWAGRPRPWHNVLDGDPAFPPPKGGSPPIFGRYLLRPNGCMDQDASWYGARPQPRRLCVRWGPSPPPKFSPHVYYSYCSCRTCVNRLYACTQIQYLCFSNYRIWVKYSGESCDVTDVICAKNRLQHVQSYRYRNIFERHRSLSQKRLKPSLGNSNVHLQRNLDREWSASELVSYRASVKYACARIHCTCFTYY